MSAYLCYCSCPDTGSAELIAQALVGERLAACVSILPRMRSIYRWEGALESSEEVLLLVKTTDIRVQALTARIVELHPYELPEVIAVEVAAGLPAYLAWIAAETDEKD